MKTVRNIAITSLFAIAMSPSLALADWDEERLRRDHPQAVAESTVQGIAAGDTTRTREATEPKTENQRAWEAITSKQEVAP